MAKEELVSHSLIEVWRIEFHFIIHAQFMGLLFSRGNESRWRTSLQLPTHGE